MRSSGARSTSSPRMAARAPWVKMVMAYVHCPTCRIAVRAATTECPRCGGELSQRLLPRALDPRAVRAALVKRGGRFRPAPAGGRLARPGPRGPAGGGGGVASRGRAGGIQPHDRARPARIGGVAPRVALQRQRLPALLARLAPDRFEAEAEPPALGEDALEPVVRLERDAQRQRAVRDQLVDRQLEPQLFDRPRRPVAAGFHADRFPAAGGIQAARLSSRWAASSTATRRRWPVS